MNFMSVRRRRPNDKAAFSWRDTNFYDTVTGRQTKHMRQKTSHEALMTERTDPLPTCPMPLLNTRLSRRVRCPKAQLAHLAARTAQFRRPAIDTTINADESTVGMCGSTHAYTRSRKTFQRSSMGDGDTVNRCNHSIRIWARASV
jgi:hypothetical protein